MLNRANEIRAPVSAPEVSVVQYSNTPCAGSPWYTHQAIVRWTEYGSTLIQNRPEYGDGRKFPSDLLYGSGSRALFSDADIVHPHNHVPLDEAIRKIIARKPMLAQHHQWPPFTDFDKLRTKRTIQAIIAQPMWVKRQREKRRDIRLVPNIVPVHDMLFRPDWDARPLAHEGKLHVVYSPSLKAGRGLHNKGYPGTTEVLRRLEAKGEITYDLIEGVPLWDALERKKKAHVAIDEVVTGNFHRCSLESLSQGVVTIAGLTDESRDFICEFLDVYDDQLPWVCTDMDGLEQTLLHLAHEPELVVELRQDSRAFMLNHWDDRMMVNYYLDLYDELLS